MPRKSSRNENFRPSAHVLSDTCTKTYTQQNGPRDRSCTTGMFLFFSKIQLKGLLTFFPFPQCRNVRCRTILRGAQISLDSFLSPIPTNSWANSEKKYTLKSDRPGFKSHSAAASICFCCVTNHSKFHDWKQAPLYPHNSTIWLGSAGPFFCCSYWRSLRRMHSAGLLAVGWPQLGWWTSCISISLSRSLSVSFSLQSQGLSLPMCLSSQSQHRVSPAG